MLSKATQIQMIEDLSNAFGPSGFEDDVIAVVRKYAEGLGSIEVDHLNNIYINRKENRGDRPILMLDAHSDEVGFMVHSIRPNGTVRIVNIGGWNLNALSSADVLVRNADGEYIPGIIAAKPVHFMSAAERAAGGGVKQISDLTVDIGAVSAQDAVENFRIRIGEPIVPASRFAYAEQRDVMTGKAFDDRIGVAALLDTLHRLKGLDLPCDVVGVISSQEEVGERGCKVAVNRVKPDIAVCLEGCPADDTFTEPYAIQTALKKGPMFRFMDVSIICSPRFQRYVLDLAEEKGLPVQSSVREGGGNNGAIINTSLDGIPVVVAGTPVRYIHSMNCITSYFDFNATASLVTEIAKSMTPEMIAKM